MLVQNRDKKDKIESGVTFYLVGRGHIHFNIDGMKRQFYISDWMKLRQKSIELRTKPREFYNWTVRNKVELF